MAATALCFVLVPQEQMQPHESVLKGVHKYSDNALQLDKLHLIGHGLCCQGFQS
jgi:hypothetical protein